jgi:hypothetical protein
MEDDCGDNKQIERVSPLMPTNNPWHLMTLSCHKRGNIEKSTDGKSPGYYKEYKMAICWTYLASTARTDSINGRDMDPRKWEED